MEPWKSDLIKMGKFLSLILRHKPETIGMTLDEHGYVDVSELIEKINASGRFIDRQMLDDIVAMNDKQRYSYNHDHTKIRANQGHSCPVNVDLLTVIPPAVLYHGTSKRSLPSIQKQGILKMERFYVHLSFNPETAFQVGARHGKPVVLEIDAKRMTKDGYEFFLSQNGVYLCKHIPSRYIKRIINQ